MIITAQVTPTRPRSVKPRKWPARDIRALATHALMSGAKFARLGVVEWDVSADCSSPRYVEYWGRREIRPTKLQVTTWEELLGAINSHDARRDDPVTVEMWTRCRRCPPCLKARGIGWAYRAKAEIAAAPRTWFGTLTLSPENHWLMQTRATARLSAGGTVFEQLSPAEQFQERHQEISREITKYLKRVRKESGIPLRYFLVCEAHKSGLPHYHILIHEVVDGQTVKHSTVRSQWPLGYSRWKLCENADAAWYCAKYLTKAALARVRASQAYGNPPSGIGGLPTVKNHPPKQKSHF